jgi:hypothetical protein
MSNNLLTRLFRRPYDSLKSVLEFHRVFKCTIGNTQFIPNGSAQGTLNNLFVCLMSYRSDLRLHAKTDLRAARLALIVEELAELTQGLAERDLKKTLDALGDLDYVEKGSVIAFGLQDVFYEACKRIHESNMSKVGQDGKAIYDAAGKVVKGPNYRPVDLSDLIDNGSH